MRSGWIRSYNIPNNIQHIHPDLTSKCLAILSNSPGTTMKVSLSHLKETLDVSITMPCFEVCIQLLKPRYLRQMGPGLSSFPVTGLPSIGKPITYNTSSNPNKTVDSPSNRKVKHLLLLSYLDTKAEIKSKFNLTSAPRFRRVSNPVPLNLARTLLSRFHLAKLLIWEVGCFYKEEIRVLA